MKGDLKMEKEKLNDKEYEVNFEYGEVNGSIKFKF